LWHPYFDNENGYGTMNDNLEAALRRLANDSGPSELADVEHRVLRQVAGYRFVTSDVLMLLSAVTVVVSLGLGVAGGWVGIGGSRKASADLVGTHPLAPSSLLADNE
jgi:hypothetical protein